MFASIGSTSSNRRRRAGRSLLWSSVFVAGFVAGVPPLSAHDDAELLAVKTFYKPGVGDTARAQGGKQAQPSQSWTGTAAVADPLNLFLAPDFHEFDVSDAYNNTRMSVAITWDAGPGLVYDLDLYVDRFDNGSWVRVGSSTNGQALGDGDAVEAAQVNAPVLMPGRYRARVANWASTQLEYTGEIVFESQRARRGGGPSGGRAIADRPDQNGLSKLHVIYFVPSDGADEGLDTDGTLEAAVTAMNDWFLRETPGRRLRLDMFRSSGRDALDITFVRGLTTQQEYAAGGVFESVAAELEARGWNDDPGLKRYLVYYGGPAESLNVCGTAYYNTLGTDYAQWSLVFLGAASGCGARDFGTPETGAGSSEAIAVQEMLHNEALARPQSLHHCWAFQGHLCTAAAGAAVEELDPESYDVLFPFVTYPLRDKLLDIDHDDFYQHPFPWNDFDQSPFLETAP